MAAGWQLGAAGWLQHRQLGYLPLVGAVQIAQLLQSVSQCALASSVPTDQCVAQAGSRVLAPTWHQPRRLEARVAAAVPRAALVAGEQQHTITTQRAGLLAPCSSRAQQATNRRLGRQRNTSEDAAVPRALTHRTAAVDEALHSEAPGAGRQRAPEWPHAQRRLTEVKVRGGQGS